jgi:hypothetical protein
MKNRSLLYSVFLLVAAWGFEKVQAQDTTRRQPRTVQVTSTFKPVLKDAAKINFNATPPVADTSRPRLKYDVPNQNLLFAYQPGSLKPLALSIDTAGYFINHNYVKLGYGSLRTPYLEADLSMGDGKTAGINLYANHISSQGKIQFQDFSNTSVDATAFYQTSNNLEWSGRIGGKQERYNKYGFEPKELSFPEDSIAVKFQTWRGRIGVRNINRTDLGLSFAPDVRIDVFNDALGNSESNTNLRLPLQKTLGTDFAVDVTAEANLSTYKPDAKESIGNNYFSVAPSVIYRTANISIHAGIKPSWDNKEFKLFPNVMAEFGTSDNRFSIQAGWIGYLRNAGYQYMAGYNPYIWAPETVYNTRIEERYAGFKGSAGDHLTYSAKAGFHKWNNQPLFVNDTASGKSFVVVRESQLKVLHIGGEVGYTVGDKFSLTSGLTFNQFNSLKDNDKAWGLIPLEWRTSLRLQVLRDLYVKSDLYAFDGPRFLEKDGSGGNLKGALDLNAGLEFKIVKNISLWAQFNNIFNMQYQRWHQYPVYPFSFIGGVVFSFDQNTR